MASHSTALQEATAIAKATAVLNSDAAFATFGQIKGGASRPSGHYKHHSFFLKRHINVGKRIQIYGISILNVLCFLVGLMDLNGPE